MRARWRLPGRTDLTAHVDFAALGAAAAAAGARVHGPVDARRVPQAARHRGARRRALGQRRPEDQRAAIAAALDAAHRHRGPAEMGDLFKVDGILGTATRLNCRGSAMTATGMQAPHARAAPPASATRSSPATAAFRRGSMRASMPGSDRMTRPRTSRPTGPAWLPRWACRRSAFSPATKSIRPTWWSRPSRGDAEARPRADAIVTATPGLAIGVSTADCGPVLFADRGRARRSAPPMPAGAAHSPA